MRAIVFDGQGGVTCRTDLTTRPLAPGQVRVATRISGISAGTETFLLRTRHDGAPMIPGYQNVGTVVERAADVTDLAVGQRVYTHHWRGGEVLLGDTAVHSGAHAASRVGPAASADLIPLPDWMPDEQAAFLSVASIGLHVARRGGVTAGQRVLVAGLGPIGLHAVQGARLLGGEVDGLDRVPTRLATGQRLGCRATFDGARADVWEELAAAGPYDVIIETTGVNALLDPLLRVVAGERDPAREMLRQGVIVMVGLRPRTEYTFLLAHHKEVTLVHTSHHTRQEVDRVLTALRDGFWAIAPLITDRVTPEAAPERYRRLLTGADDALAIAIDWTDDQ